MRRSRSYVEDAAIHNTTVRPDPSVPASVDPGRYEIGGFTRMSGKPFVMIDGRPMSMGVFTVEGDGRSLGR